MPVEARKADIALELLDHDDVAVSVQVLQEFYVQATRPTRGRRLSHAEAVALVEAFLRFRVQELTPALMLNAIAASQRFRISYWDAAIIEAARGLGCRVVLSEDLSHGADYAGVRVEDPFRGAA